MQLLPVTEQPAPKKLEHWHTPGFPPPVPVLPAPPPQLQLTVESANTTPGSASGEYGSRARNGLALITDDFAVKPGSRILSFVFTAFSFLWHVRRPSTAVIRRPLCDQQRKLLGHLEAHEDFHGAAPDSHTCQPLMTSATHESDFRTVNPQFRVTKHPYGFELRKTAGKPERNA